MSGFQQARFQVLVATDIASRGLHVDDVAHVINYDLPKMPKTSFIVSGAPGEPGLKAAHLRSLQGGDPGFTEYRARTAVENRA